jgi:hypothetical protein
VWAGHGGTLLVTLPLQWPPGQLRSSVVCGGLCAGWRACSLQRAYWRLCTAVWVTEESVTGVGAAAAPLGAAVLTVPPGCRIAATGGSQVGGLSRQPDGRCSSTWMVHGRAGDSTTATGRANREPMRARQSSRQALPAGLALVCTPGKLTPPGAWCLPWVAGTIRREGVCWSVVVRSGIRHLLCPHLLPAVFRLVEAQPHAAA